MSDPIVIALTDELTDPVTDVSPGDKIVWKNATDPQKSTSVNPPSCVSPHQSDTMPNTNDESRQYTVNNSRPGTYTYTYSVGEALAPRNGTIKV